jgi:pimeloyl-ACP methyl ester carboxylesterase
VDRDRGSSALAEACSRSGAVPRRSILLRVSATPIPTPQAPLRRALQRGPVELSCLDFGGAGPPVLLLHGLAGHAGEWGETAGWLAREHRVLALEERGHGHSTTDPGDVSPQARVADVAHVIERLAGAPVVLAGQSLGANLAFLVAARHPDLVRALIVAEGYPGGDPEGTGAAAIERWLESWPVPFRTREAAVSFFGGPGLRGGAWAEGLASRGRGLRPRFQPEVIVQMLREAIAEDHWADWEDVVCPTLVVRAGEGYFAAPDMEAMAERAQAGHYRELPGAGHDLHLDRPAEWRRVVTEFLLTAG